MKHMKHSKCHYLHTYFKLDKTEQQTCARPYSEVLERFKLGAMPMMACVNTFLRKATESFITSSAFMVSGQHQSFPLASSIPYLLLMERIQGS